MRRRVLLAVLLVAWAALGRAHGRYLTFAYTYYIQTIHVHLHLVA
jgi:hypothetical protein